MAGRIKFRGGTSEQHSTFTGATREITIDTSKNTVVVHDGSTVGGFALARDSVVTSILETKVDKNADIVAGTGTKVTYDAKGLVTGSSTPTTLAGYSISDAYTKTEVNNSLALKVDDSEIARVNLLRADKYLAAQNVANMSYNGSGKLSKVQYNNSTDVDYEVLTYNVDGKLSNVAHYTTSTLRGNTVLRHRGGTLVSALSTGVEKWM